MANVPSREEVQTPQSIEGSEPGAEMKAEQWSAAIHHFHITGDRRDIPEPIPLSSPLVPALLVQLEKEGRLQQQYPFHLSSESGRSQPLTDLLKDFLEQYEKEGEGLRIIANNLPELSSFLNRPNRKESEQLKPEVFASVADVFDLSSAGKATLERELEILQKMFPWEGKLIRLGSAALLSIFSWAFDRESRPFRQKFLKDVEQALKGLNAILLVDEQKSPKGRSPESIAAVIGQQGTALIDSASLSQSIPKQEGSLCMSSERRERIEKTRDLLSAFLSEASNAPKFYLAHSEPLDSIPDSSHIKSIHDSNSLETALELFGRILENTVEVFKSIRIARLEIAGEYESELHDGLLERFDWRSCEADELRAVTPVVVWESAENVLGSGLSSLSRIIRSGLPLRVLISSPNLASEKDLSDSLPDLGHLIVAHREAFVVQSSLAKPSVLSDQLRVLSKSLRPAVAIVAGPTKQTVPQWSWPESVVAHLSRTLPIFTYDPDAGGSWADRLVLGELEEKQKQWLSVNWSYTDSDGTIQSKTEALTFAHAAALQLGFRKHFLTIPEEVWDEQQIELGEYLNAYEEEPPRAIPFIWIVGPDELPQKAVVTRSLVSASRDRQRSWSVLQELAGINNEYVRRAVEETSKKVESSVRAELKTIGERERLEGAAQAIDRLVAVFTNPTALEAPAVSDQISMYSAEQPKVEEKPGEEARPVEAPEEEAEEEFSAEPYIDSFLCTSCNDCINLNPLLFKYNEDKQAVIGDVSAGTFLQLVKAAEACPAKCIHPGAPAPHDETATAEVIARAQAFR